MNRLSAPVLKLIWKAMSLPGKPPPVYSDPGTKDWGYKPWDRREAVLRPDIARTLQTLAFPGHRDLTGLNVLAHEYAHVAQPMVLPERIREGGAEAYSIQRAQALQNALRMHPWNQGAPGQGDFYRGGMSYPAWTRPLLRGPQHVVTRGQFGR